jgi:hypothetical protein
MLHMFTNIVGSSTWKDIVDVGNIQQMTTQLKNAFNYIPI